MQPIKEVILNSIQPIVADSHFVSINPDRLKQLALKLKDIAIPPWDNELQLKADLTQTIQYYFFLDSINFCFWAPKGQERWHFEKDGQWLSGYYAYSFAIKQAFESDARFYDATYIATMPFDEFTAIFAGRGQLLQLEKRWQIIQENFRILADQFDGQAVTLVQQAGGDVNQFIALLLEHFPSFRDQVQFNGQTVYFLKRPQILPSDISFAFPEEKLFTNLDDLSIYADYKLPQLLQAEGVLDYGDDLLNTVKNEQLIEPGSQMEIEIRAWTIEACDQLVRELQTLGRSITNSELDWILWVQAKQTNFVLPHHKTLTTFY